jgi:hypothetical protein
MTNAITKEWLDRAYPRKLHMVQRKVINEWWDCGWRADSGVITAIRVLEMGDDTYAAEIAQNVDGADVEWASGVCIPVSCQETLRDLCALILTKEPR